MRPIASAAAAAAKAICDADKILEAARHTGAKAIHPGYGFLSEKADFAEAVRCARAFVFIGPTPAADARFRAEAYGARTGLQKRLPLLPGTGLLDDRGRRGRQAHAYRLSGDAEKHGGRRRHRHAVVLERGGIGRRL